MRCVAGPEAVSNADVWATGLIGRVIGAVGGLRPHCAHVSGIRQHTVACLFSPKPWPPSRRRFAESKQTFNAPVGWSDLSHGDFFRRGVTKSVGIRKNYCRGKVIVLEILFGIRSYTWIIRLRLNHLVPSMIRKLALNVGDLNIGVITQLRLLSNSVNCSYEVVEQ